MNHVSIQSFFLQVQIQIVTKLNKLKFGQNLKTQILTTLKNSTFRKIKLKNSSCDKTQKLKFSRNLNSNTTENLKL